MAAEYFFVILLFSVVQVSVVRQAFQSCHMTWDELLLSSSHHSVV
jgi:hypothetical protein